MRTYQKEVDEMAAKLIPDYKPRLPRKVSKRRLQKKRIAMFKQALMDHNGNVSHACLSLDLHPSAYYRLLDEDKKFAEWVKLFERQQSDWVAGKLLEKIDEGDSRSIEFYLKTKGSAHGWAPITKVEAEVKQEVFINLSGVNMPYPVVDVTPEDAFIEDG